MNPAALIDRNAQRVVIVPPTACTGCDPITAPLVGPGNDCPECGKRKGGARYKCAATGKAIPGCTTIISAMIAKPGLIYWSAGLAVDHIEAIVAEGRMPSPSDLGDARRAHTRKRDEGADIGTQAHDCLQAWLSGDPFDTYLPDDGEARRAVQAGLAYLERVKPRTVAVEAVCVDPDTDAVPPRWAGRADLVYEDAGGLVVADWKSTKSGLYPESYLQLGAYASSVQAATGETVVRTELVHIDRETGGFRVAVRDLNDWLVDARDFYALVDVRRRMQERGREVKKAMKAEPITGQERVS